METMETFQIGSVVGNTRPPLRVIPSKYWCFTLNNFSESEYATIINKITELNCKYILGTEGASKTTHIQGYIECPKKIRASEAFENKRIHWEKRKGTREDNIKYCSKEGNYITNIEIPIINKITVDIELNEWELEIMEIIKKIPDERKVYWYYDLIGGCGKTTFCKYLINKSEYIHYLTGAKKQDILYYVGKILEKSGKKNNNIVRTFIFDFSRSNENFISYESIEQVKNGLIFSSKYESNTYIFTIPHIIIFANFEPDEFKLSKDRWEIKEIKK